MKWFRKRRPPFSFHVRSAESSRMTGMSHIPEGEREPMIRAFLDSLDRSSLGTDEARAARASVSDERAAAVVRRAREMEDEHDCDERCDHLGEWLEGKR